MVREPKGAIKFLFAEAILEKPYKSNTLGCLNLDLSFYFVYYREAISYVRICAS